MVMSHMLYRTDQSTCNVLRFAAFSKLTGSILSPVTPSMCSAFTLTMFRCLLYLICRKFTGHCMWLWFTSVSHQLRRWHMDLREHVSDVLQVLTF